MKLDLTIISLLKKTPTMHNRLYLELDLNDKHEEH
jgi:hypothetical protein